jgi:zinc protease
MNIRLKQPETQQIEHISFVKPHIFDVTENVKFLWMKDVPNDTVRFDIYFDAGVIRGNQSIPSIVHSLLFSGTEREASVEIHERIDALGGFLDTDISFEMAVVTIYCLREHLFSIAQIVEEAISNCTFRENEVQDTLRSMEQKFKENKQKVRNVAQQQFRKSLFESHEAYATLAALEDFQTERIAEYKRFWKTHYVGGMTRMTLAGNVDQDTVDALIDLFGKWSKDELPHFESTFTPVAKTIHFPMEKAVQTAIRVGTFLFPKTHPDYLEFQVLNTILGDYFGSRLMANIREDKGYTYGIGSAIMELNQNGYFVIVTEVASEVTENTLTEIQFELKHLQEELVTEDELSLVKNYMLGQLLKSADGPYAMLDLYNSADMYGLDFEFYDLAIAKIREITPERIKELALKYLNWDDFLVITAG